MAAPRYVTHAELEPVRQAIEPMRLNLERLAIRVEVLTHDVHHLTNQLGDLAEDFAGFRSDVAEGFSAVDARLHEVNRRFDALTKVVEDGHAAILSAILAKR